MIWIFALLASAWAAPSKSTVIFVHGGAWVSGAVAQYQTLEKDLSARGYCVHLLEYDLAPAAKHPAPVKQLNAAISHPGSCDGARIFLVGHSAGAHMIAFWNTAFANPHVKGFVGLEGIYDLGTLIKRFPAYEEQFVRAEFGAERSSISPARLPVRAKAPWLLIHSDEDELVDLAQTLDFEKHLRAAGVSVKVVRIKGSHFAAVQSLEDAGSAASKALAGFIF